MRRLAEAEDEASLADGQRVEERVGSIDYDVWACPACSQRVTLRYPKWITAYDECPQCRHRTKSSTETVLTAATVDDEGSARVVDRCAFCNYELHQEPGTHPAEQLVGWLGLVERRIVRRRQFRRRQFGRRRREPRLLRFGAS